TIDQSFTISGTADGGGGAKSVILLIAGHAALDRDWPNGGASSWNGNSGSITLAGSPAVHITGQPANSVVDAGADQIVCAAASAIVLSGAISPLASGFFWQTSGSGIFSNPYSLTTTYIPSPGDLSAGSVSLRLNS